MANVLIEEDTMRGIADAIRSKGNTSALLLPGEMPPAVLAIPSGEGNNGVVDGIVDRSVTGTVATNASIIGNAAFYMCTGLEGLIAPNATSIEDNGMYNCSTLSLLTVPLVKTVRANCLRGSAALSVMDFPSLETIYTNAFYNSGVTALILRVNKVCVLQNINALTGTSIEGGTGYVYVPTALVASYKAAANWINFAAQIRAIEDYPEITGGGGIAKTQSRHPGRVQRPFVMRKPKF